MRPILAALLLVVLALPARAEAPRVVVSIKPLHGLTAALLDGIAEPTLLLDGAASPHAYALRPSDRRALQAADVVVWVGPGLEGFLVKPLSVLPDGVRVVGLLAETPGLHRLPFGEHGHDHGAHADDEHAEDQHDGDQHDGGEHNGDEHGGDDPHIWLSPANARAIVRHLADVLAPLAPAARLQQNADALDRRLTALEADLGRRVTPVRERPFVVFHPAYNYFVEAFGLRQVGAVTLSPERGAGARHLSDLRRAVAADGAVCAFHEPQFAERSVAGLARDTGLRTAVLDPLGTTVPAGPQAYDAILTDLAGALIACLRP